MNYIEDVGNKRFKSQETKVKESPSIKEMFRKRLSVGLEYLANYDSEMAQLIKDTPIMDRIANVLYQVNMMANEFYDLVNRDTIKGEVKDYNPGAYKKFLMNINTLILPLMFSRDKSFLEKIFVKELLEDEGLLDKE